MIYQSYTGQYNRDQSGGVKSTAIQTSNLSKRKWKMNIGLSKISNLTAVSETEDLLVSGSDSIGKLYNVLGDIASSESCNANKGQVVQNLSVLSAQPTSVGSKEYYYPSSCELNTEQNTTESQQVYGESYDKFESESA